jgi:hypothetical protein
VVAAALVAAPAVLCGGLTLVAPDSWLPQLAALVMVPVALAAVALASSD